ncbi:MAG: nitrite reductase small subunit NirD [Leptospirales bacterium]|jgi:nitrite reductase (NADH) small subunit
MSALDTAGEQEKKMNGNITAPAPGADLEQRTESWCSAGAIHNFPINAGIAVRIGGRQVAVYRLRRETAATGGDLSRDEWYACDNACPHKNDNVLARGLVGDHQGELMVACPMHKKAFALSSGACLNDPDYRVRVYPIKISNGEVYVAVDAE